MDKKRSNLLGKSSPIEPVETYNRSNLYSVASDTPEPKNTIDDKIEKNRGKRTSLSCYQDTKNKIQALMTMTKNKNVDDMLNLLISNYQEVMTDDELIEFRFMTKTLDKATIRTTNRR